MEEDSQRGTSKKRSNGESGTGDSEDMKRRRTTSAVTVDLYGVYLPSLVAMKISRLLVESEGAFPSLCHLSGVNWFWRSIAKESSLIQKVKLPAKLKIKNDQLVIQIAGAWDLSKVKEIDFSEWNMLTDFGLQVLADSCPQLTCANLSGTAISNAGFQYLVDQCPELTDINLSSLKTDAPYGAGLQCLIRNRGKAMHSICLARNSLKNFTPTLNLIISVCVELRLLDLSNVTFSHDPLHLDIGKLQTVCTKLEVLRLEGSPFYFCCSVNQADSKGFPELRELNIGSSHAEHALQVSNGFLNLLLKASADLKILNVSGQGSLTPEGLDSLPVKDLESLYISNCSAANLEGIGVVMNKWLHSLRQLDLSSNVFAGMTLDMVLQKRNRHLEKSRLTFLSLTSTQITTSSICSLLNELPCLTRLHLGGCRGLPRVMQSEYNGPELAQLRLDVASIVVTNTGGAHRALG